MGFFTRAQASKAGHLFARFVQKLERLFSEIDLAPEFFGEGIALLKNEVVQLTWLSHTGFVYNLSDFGCCADFRIPERDGVLPQMAVRFS
jgi:glutamine cyclotransferase